MRSLNVTELAIYPIKSMHQHCVDAFELDRFGPCYDRRWMLVDKHGKFITQRQYPRMVLISVFLESTGLVVSAPGMPPLNVPFVATGEPCEVQVWRDHCKAIRLGAAYGDWFERFLGIACDLVFMPDTTLRRVDETYATAGETVSFADGFPILLTTEASLSALNDRLSEAIPMKRFRPNIVVAGNAPFEEDTWQEIRIGSVPFKVVKPCSRCVIPSINTRTAEKNRAPLEQLKAFRQRGREIYFGQNLIPLAEGTVRKGDQVEILTEKGG